MPFAMQSRSGRSPHCSDANSVPVRPNPVATSSQIRSTSCAARVAECPQPVRIAEQHARRSLHEWFHHHGRELGSVLRDQPDRLVEAAGIVERGRAAPGKRKGS